MSRDWADSFDQLSRSPALPMWLLLAIIGFVGLILLVALSRAERSVANGTLAVLTVAAIAIAVVIFLREGSGKDATSPTQISQTSSSSLPALSCLDDLAGETVLTACEKMLFSSPDMAAAAVAYTASQLNRLKSFGDVAAAERVMTPDLQALRRALERDRYGLVAYVLAVRDRCQPAQCAAYALLTDRKQITANMSERVYEAAIEKYASNWNAPSSAAGGSASLMAPTQPTGKATSADFPTSSSIPPVSIMTPEPPLGAPRLAPPPAPAPRAAATATPPPAPKKQPAAPKKQPSAGPVPLAPAPSSTAPVAPDQ